MADAFATLLPDPSGATHGLCLPPDPWLIWTQALANGAVGLACFSMLPALAHFVRRRPDLISAPLAWLFATLILLGGAGHWIGQVTLWVPAHGTKAVADVATATVAVAAAVALWPLMPKALALPSPGQLQAANVALRESEARCRVLSRQAPLPMQTLDGDGRLVAVNDRWLEFFGFTEDEVVGRPVTDFMTMDSAAAFHGNWADFLERRACGHMEFRVLTRAGEAVDVSWSARVFRAGQDTAILTMDVPEDVTARRLAGAALERNRAVLAALESAGESVFTLSADWRFTFMNGCARLLLAEGRDVVGQVLWEAIEGLDGTWLLAACRRCMTGRVPSEAGQFFGPQQRYYALRAFPSDEGSIAVFIRDMTGERRAGEELRTAEAKASEVLESIQDAFFAGDAQWRFSYVNRHTEALFGRTRDGLLGRRILDVFPEASESETTRNIRLALSDRTPREFEAVSLVLGHWISGVVYPQADGGFAVYFRDISERKRAEAALLESQERLRDLMETVNLGVFLTRDHNGTIVFWSEGCTRLYGWTAGEAVGRTTSDLLRTAYPVPLPDIEAAVERDGEWNGDVRHVTRSGRELVVAANLVRRHAPDADTPMFLEALTDVTAQRQAEQDLAELNRNLEARVREAVKEREDAQERAKHAQHMQALGQIAGGVAHEFNNILQAVQGGVQVIENRAADPASVRKFARIVMKTSERGSVITNRLLSFARRSAFRTEPIAPAAMLDAIRDVLEHTLGGQVAVRVQLRPNLPDVIADKGELEAALVNLATNARDAMPGGGTLTLEARLETVEAAGIHPAALKPGRFVRLIVRDHGTGMDPVILARAAEPFFTTKPPGTGTGLGLPMAKGFAEQSGGGLAIESEPGRGTTVTLWLPAADTGTGTAATPTGASDPQAAGKPPAHVLLVDDEEMVRETLAAGLEDAGLAVLVAASGEEALALLDAGEPVDLLVTDLSMPGMDGMMLIRHARARRSDLPALILTGYVDIAEQAAANSGAGAPSAVLRKPIGASQLAERMEETLAAKARSAGMGTAARPPS